LKQQQQITSFIPSTPVSKELLAVGYPEFDDNQNWG
jgi:hypothetical protein